MMHRVRLELAIRVRDARDAGRNWNGPGGVVEDTSFPEVNSAVQERNLLREIAADKRTADGRIAQSYERTPAVLEKRRRLAAVRRAGASRDLPALAGCDCPKMLALGRNRRTTNCRCSADFRPERETVTKGSQVAKGPGSRSLGTEDQGPNVSVCPLTTNARNTLTG